MLILDVHFVFALKGRKCDLVEVESWSLALAKGLKKKKTTKKKNKKKQNIIKTVINYNSTSVCPESFVTGHFDQCALMQEKGELITRSKLVTEHYPQDLYVIVEPRKLWQVSQ